MHVCTKINLIYCSEKSRKLSMPGKILSKCSAETLVFQPAILAKMRFLIRGGSGWVSLTEN